MSEREILLAILYSLGALAERLTGERLEVMVPTSNGEVVISSGYPVRWAPRTAVAEVRPSSHPAPPAKHS